MALKAKQVADLVGAEKRTIGGTPADKVRLRSVTFRANVPDMAALARWSARKGVSLGGALRMAVSEFLERAGGR